MDDSSARQEEKVLPEGHPANQRVKYHTLEIQVMNSAGKVLGNGCAPLVNNANTTVTFLTSALIAARCTASG